jgi:GTP-binding protein
VGKGLGLQFLRHVERTRLLAFLLPLDRTDLQAVYDQLRHEIRVYSAELAGKPHVVLFSKRDVLAPGAPLPGLEAPDAMGALAFSSVAGTGLEDLKEYLWKAVKTARARDQR